MTSAAQPSPDGLVERDAELGPGGRTAPSREETTPGAHRAGRQRRVTVAAWLGLHGRRAVGRRPGSRRRGRRFLHGLPDGHCRAVPAWRPGTADSRQQRHPGLVPEHDGGPTTPGACPDPRASPQPPNGRSPARHPRRRGGRAAAAGSAAGGAAASRRGRDGRRPGQPLDHGGDAVKGPVVGVEAVRAAPCLSAWSMAASWGRQACGRPDGAGAAQCLQPTCLPAAGVLSGDARLAGDLGLGAAGGKQYNNRTSRLPAMPGLTSLAPTWRRIR